MMITLKKDRNYAIKVETTIDVFPSEMHALSFGIAYRTVFVIIGPSGVRALPLAAAINVGGHYFR